MVLTIIDAHVMFGGVELLGWHAWYERQARDQGSAVTLGDPFTPDEGAPPAVAYLNQARWVADCPSICAGAAYVATGIPFMCGSCFNVEIGGRYRTVEWPAADERRHIETAVRGRPDARLANWTSVERPGYGRVPRTVAGLVAENRSRGLD